jgi:cell division transport system permease protein
VNLSSLGFLIYEAFLSIRRHGLMSLAALGTVTVALTVLGGSTWLAFRITEVAQEQPQKFNVIEVFLNDDVSGERTLALQRRVVAIAGVKSVHLVSRDEEWAMLRHREPSLTEAVPVNPLMDRLDVEAVNGSNVGSLAACFRDRQRFPEVQQVNDANQEVRVLLSFAHVLKVIGITLASGLFVGTLFIVQNTIRLTVVARRREIRIMQLVGATPGFIRLPFLIEGVFHGLVGGLLASAILMVCAHEISGFVSTLHSPLVGDVESRISASDVISGMIAIGVLTGLIGSTLSLRRFLHEP